MGKRTSPVRINKLFPPYIKVPGTPGRAKEIYALLVSPYKYDIPLNQSYTDVTLQLESESTFNGLRGGTEWWQINMIQKERNKNPQTRKEKPWLERTLDKLIIVGFVDKVFPSTFSFIAGGGILGLYTTLVLVVGRFIRMLVTGAMYRIMFEELPNVDRILQLCLDIFLVREAGELMLEEDLYAKLIFSDRLLFEGGTTPPAPPCRGLYTIHFQPKYSPAPLSGLCHRAFHSGALHSVIIPVSG